ncbi:MAG: HAD family hydrolase [Leptospiraceae bacterium]|nr:HAD family hydrolase [Leptospiraceae bacterium]MDW7976270.1 HAD family hydrolase [Leptospiraceae bacterium]
MRKTKIIKGIIFDLDGTIIDTLPDLANSVNYGLQKVGLEKIPTDIIKGFIGDGMKSLIEKTLNDLYNQQKISLEEKEKLFQIVFQYFFELYDRNCVNLTKPYEGVVDFLEEFRDRYKFAILTNKSDYFTKKIIKQLDLEKYFSHILSGDVEEYKKPKPNGIKKIQQDWNLSEDEIIVVGDHYTDILSAKNANVKSIFAMYGYGKLNGYQPNYSIKQFSSLKVLLKILQE